MMKKLKLTLRSREAVMGYVFILPWLVGFLWFFAANFGAVVWQSFCEVVVYPEGGSERVFVGLANYKELFTVHATFNKTLVNSVTDLVIDVPLITFFSLFIAIMLNRKFPGRGLVRAIYFLPVVLASGAVTGALQAILRAMFNGISNVSDDMVSTSGLNVQFVIRQFTEYGVPAVVVEYIMAVVSRMYDIIKASGVQILIFLAALQAIPGSLYEVSQIEGATAYESFWKITFPMVSPLILTNVVYTIVDNYTNGQLVSLARETAFQLFDLGLAACMNLIGAAVACIVLLVVGAVISAYTFYQN